MIACVCLSHVESCITMAKHIITQTTPYDSLWTVVIWHERFDTIPLGSPLTGAKCRWLGKNCCWISSDFSSSDAIVPACLELRLVQSWPREWARYVTMNIALSFCKMTVAESASQTGTIYLCLYTIVYNSWQDFNCQNIAWSVGNSGASCFTKFSCLYFVVFVFSLIYYLFHISIL